MKQFIIFLIVLSILISISPELSAQKVPARESKNIDCPPFANIAATDNGEWKSGAYIQKSLIGAQLFTFPDGDHLLCYYESWWGLEGPQFNLYQKTPDGLPYCFTRTDNRGFTCRNWKLELHEHIPFPF